jgi:hypothetical protein
MRAATRERMIRMTQKAGFFVAETRLIVLLVC